MRPSFSMIAFGYVVLEVSAENIARVENALFNLGVQFKTQLNREKKYKLIMGRKQFFRFKHEAPEAFELCTYLRNAGSTVLLAKMKMRWGAVIGALLAVIIYVIFSGLVWEVRIEGADGYDTDIIQDELSSLGLREGAVIGRIDTDSITSAFLLSHPQISWMNIRLRGTVATVYCKTSDLPPKSDFPPKGTGSNLIAVSDGIIEQLNIKKGRAVVLKGGVVHKGEVLVSGIYETASGDFITYAEGEVLAKVTHEYTVTVDFRQTETVYTPDSVVTFNLRIFGRNMNLIAGETDLSTTEYISRVYIFDTIRLPIVYEKTTAYKAVEQTVILSDTEAMKLAYSRLSVLLTKELCGSQLISKEINGEFTDTGYTLHCTVTAVENIAKAIEFNIN